MSKKESSLTAERLRELVIYNPDTGIFIRRVATGRHGCHKAGLLAGTSIKLGYLKLSVDNREYLAHRLAFLYVLGRWPLYYVDHIDHDTSNNSFANLRDVTNSVNCQNRQGPQKNNTSGLIGVEKNHKRFAARIKVNDKRIYLGTYDSPQEANAAYMEAKRRLHEGNTL